MLTDLQKKMMIAIARSEFTVVNGAEPQTIDDVGEVWTNVIVESLRDANKEEITTKVARGVWTSLLNAGLIDGYGGRDGGTWFTEAGWEVYQRECR